MRWVVILITLSCFNCEERYEFNDIEPAPPTIVIQGGIFQDSLGAEVRIQQTREAGTATPIRGANVLLIGPKGQEELKELKDGYYRSQSEVVCGMHGEAYFIEVTLSNGSAFRSLPDTLPTSNATDSITWREELLVQTSQNGLDFEVPAIFLDVHSRFEGDFGTQYYHWVGEETYAIVPTDFPDPFNSIPPNCYVTRLFGSERVNIFSHSGSQVDEIELTDFMVREMDDSFVTKHIFSVYRYGISGSYYEYLRKIKALVENNGSLFDSPPGDIQGNLVSLDGGTPVRGYFFAAQKIVTRKAVFPNQIATFIVDDCAYNPAKRTREYDRVCVNCLTYPGSTYTRPGFWTKVN